MSKKNFVTLILSTVGGILFAIGMCMCLLPEWNAFAQGVVIAAVGAVILLIMVIVRRKMEGKPVIVKLSGKTIGSILLGIVGAWCWNVHGYGLGDANPGHFGGRCRHRSAALFNPVDKRFEVRRHLL